MLEEGVLLLMILTQEERLKLILLQLQLQLVLKNGLQSHIKGIIIQTLD